MTAGSILLLMVAMAYATVTDFRWGRIPNQLTFPMLAGGLILRALTGGQDGFLSGLGGAGVALALMFVPFVMNWLGAGDVKLAMVVGVLMGPGFTLTALLFTAVVGGVIIVAYTVWKRQVVSTLRYLFLFWSRPTSWDVLPRVRFPYGPAMAIGSAIALLFSLAPLTVGLQLPALSHQLSAFSGELLAIGGQLQAGGSQLFMVGLPFLGS